MHISWPITIILLMVLFTIGAVSLFSPITVAKITILGPWIDPSLEDLMSPKAREARRLIKSDPDAFAERFSSEIDTIRIGGSVAFLCFFFGLFSILLG